MNRTEAPIRTDGPWSIWVAGRPVGDVDALIDAFLARGPQGIGDHPGSWALVAERRGEEGLHVAVDAFAGVPLFVRGGEARTDPSGWRGPLAVDAIRRHLDADVREPWRTWIDGVWRIPAGHGGRLGGPSDLRRIHVPVGSSRSLGAVVEQCVADRWEPGPWVALSGGLDSAVVAAVLAARGDVTAITNRFPGWTCDEGVLADATAAHLGIQRVDVDSRAGMDRVADLLAPPAFPPVLANHHLTLALLAPGRTLYTGFGGDEVFGHGFDVVRERIAAGRPVRAVLDALALAVRYRHAEATLAHELERWLREAAGAMRRPTDPAMLRARRIRRFTDPLLARSREEQLTLAQRVGARIEMPLLDPRIAAVGVERPASARVRRGRTRVHVREAFADRLAPAVCRATTKADLSRTVDEPVLALLQRFSVELGDPAFGRHLSSLERVRLGSGIQGMGGGEGPWLWRAVGAARYLAWHTGS